MIHAYVTFRLAYFSLLLSWWSIEFRCFFTLSTVLAFRKSASRFKCWTVNRVFHNSRQLAQWHIVLQATQLRISHQNLTKCSRLVYGIIPSCLRTTCSVNICRARISCHFILHTAKKRGKNVRQRQFKVYTLLIILEACPELESSLNNRDGNGNLVIVV